MQTCGQIITRALLAAKAPGYTAQAAGLLNAILQHLCETRDLAVARGLFSFTFNSQAASMIGGQNIFASGPYPLPLDYLRTSGSSGSDGTQKSTIWYLNGVPYPMVPADLATFDIQVQQAGNNTYPSIWATDMAQRDVVLTVTGNTYGNTTLDTLPSTQGLVPGMTVLGPTVSNLIIQSVGAGSVVLTSAASGSQTGGVFDFGYPAVGYAYPPPSGNMSVNLRYQRMMPDLAIDGTGNLTAAAANSTPWFPDVTYLERELISRLMWITDDSRLGEFEAGAMRDLTEYLQLKDDDTNRAKVIGLDRNRFGKNWTRLRTTKSVGWC